MVSLGLPGSSRCSDCGFTRFTRQLALLGYRLSRRTRQLALRGYKFSRRTRQLALLGYRFSRRAWELALRGLWGAASHIAGKSGGENLADEGKI